MFRAVFWFVAVWMVGLYVALIFWVAPQLANAASGLPLFDLRITGYSLAGAEQYFKALAPQGREIYLTLWYPLDMAFLLFLSAFFTLSIRVLFPADKGFWRLVSVVLPLAYGVSDAVENLLVSAMFRVGVARLPEGLVLFASMMTQVKFLLFGTLAVLLATGLWRRFLAARAAA